MYEIQPGDTLSPDQQEETATRVLVQEWNTGGKVSLSFYLSPDDPVSRIFE